MRQRYVDVSNMNAIENEIAMSGLGGGALGGNVLGASPEYGGWGGLGAAPSLPGFPQSCYDVDAKCPSIAGKVGAHALYDEIKRQYSDPACDDSCKQRAVDFIFHNLQPQCAEAVRTCPEVQLSKATFPGFPGACAQLDKACPGVAANIGAHQSYDAVLAQYNDPQCGVDCKTDAGNFILDSLGPACLEALRTCVAKPPGPGPGPSCGTSGQPCPCCAGYDCVAGRCQLAKAPEPPKKKMSMLVVGGIAAALALGVGAYVMSQKKKRPLHANRRRPNRRIYRVAR